MIIEDNMTDEEFENFRKIIYDEIGINLMSHKKIMLQGRIRKRLKKLGMNSYSKYYALILEDKEELLQMFNVVSTNKTEFFRENHHFDFLNEIIPKMAKENLKSGNRKFSIWSSASSTGEEPYSIAMTVLNHKELDTYKVKVIASDISTDVLTRADLGIYKTVEMNKVPSEFKEKYLTEKGNGYSAINPEVKNLVKFRRINLKSESFPFRGEFEVIFCRNVMIYFDRETQSNIILNFLKYLKKDGYLILGSSESLPAEIADKNLLKRIRSTIYQKK